MKKKDFILPSFADLSQDIAGPIPTALLQQWENSDKTEATHEAILSPYKKKVTIVSSDSSGLTKLTGEKSLLEVLKLVSEPKESIYSFGKKIGGRSIGIWAADNTQMVYDSHIHPKLILQQMVAAQNEIQKGHVQLGIAIHQADVWEIGGGLFGQHADFIEEIAENYTLPGEIVISDSVKIELNDFPDDIITLRTDLDFEISVYRFDYSKYFIEALKHDDFHYPFPFDRDFFYLIRDKNLQDEKDRALINSKYAMEKIVILIKVKHKSRNFLLDKLSDWVMANAIINKIAEDYPLFKIKSNGDLGIFLIEDSSQAFDFAIDLQQALHANDFKVNIALSKGEVLIFHLGNDVREIAGNPVNIASKLAEDANEEGVIFIEESVEYNNIHHYNIEKFSIKTSSVLIRGFKLKL